MKTSTFVIATLLCATACSHADVAEPGSARGRDTELANSAVESIYLLKQLGPNQYAVDLTGGQSELESGWSRFGLREPEPRSVVRRLRGRVLDESGLPVAGAVVLGGDRLSLGLTSSITASHGTTTDDEGAFVLPLTSSDTMHVFALADEGAWSPSSALSAGTQDAELTLTLGMPAVVRGTVTRGGAPVKGAVYVRSPGETGLAMRFVSEDDGRFESPPIPPGEYRVSFTLDHGLGADIGLMEDRRVSLTSGDQRALEVDLPVGVDVAASFDGLDEPALRTMTFTLLQGHHAPANPVALRELLGREDAPEHRQLLQGGSDLFATRVFTDVLPGPHTLCVLARGADDPLAHGDEFRTLDFRCRTLEVDGDDQDLRFMLSTDEG